MPEQAAIAPFTDHVLRALADLRAQLGPAMDNLSGEHQEDLERLVSAGAALEALLGSGGDQMDESTRRHDIMNVLGAMRGYSEFLIEDLQPIFPHIASALERVLKAVSTATNGGTPSTASAPAPAPATLESRDTVRADMTGTIEGIAD